MKKQPTESNPISPVILGTDTGFEDINFTLDYKEYRRKWDTYPKEFTPSKFPLHLDIELTNCCNLQCIMCPRQKLERPLGSMDFDLFKRIIDEGTKKGLCAVNLNLLGEPFLYAKLEEAIAYCKEKGLLDIHLHTNALLLTEKNAHMLVKSKIDSIKVSIDAATKETYQKVRIGSDYDTVVENIKRLVRIRNLAGSKTPKIKINLIEMKDTAHEIAQAIEFWKPIVNQIAILRYIYSGVGEDYSVNEVRKKSDFSCPFVWQKLSIYWDGRIPICFRCSATNDNIIGDANETSIESIWNSEVLQGIRKIHVNKNYLSHELCAECHVPQEEMSTHIIGGNDEGKE